MMEFLATIGRVFLAFLAHAGRLSAFTAMAVSHTVRPPFYLRLILRSMVEIGYYSLPVIGLSNAATKYTLNPPSRSCDPLTCVASSCWKSDA